MRNWTGATLVAVALTLCTSTGFARSHHIVAFAPFELFAAGFADLAGVVVDAEDGVLVADRRAGTVTRVASDQRRVTIASHLDQPTGIALDDAGRLLVAEEGGGRVVRVERDGRKTTIIPGLKSPRWLVVDEAGTVYVSARRLSRSGLRDLDLEEVDPEVIFAWSTTRGLRVFADDFRQLEGLALGEGVIYAAARGRRPAHAGEGLVYRIAVRPDGTSAAPTPIASLERFQRPFGITRDRLGALYTTARRLRPPHFHGDDLVVKLAADGTRSLFASGLQDPQGVAFDSAGNLYVADGDTGRVLRFQAPAPPVLDALPEFTQQSTVLVAGRADRNALITIAAATDDVTVPTHATGRFSTTVTIGSDMRTALEVFATPVHGMGLTSPPAEAVITHDGTAPAVAFVAPVPGAFVRGVVMVEARSTDAGSGIETLRIVHGTQPLAVTIAPPLPASTATVTASWETNGLAEGTQAVSVTAVDRAGHATVAHRLVLVDNTPPETAIITGPAGPVSDPSVTFTFGGNDNLSVPASLHYSWRLDESPWSAFSAFTTIALSGISQGAHRFEVRARDQAGNEDATPARRDFTVGSSRVTIMVPAVGAVVPSGVVVVRGAVEGMVGEIGVVVNDIAALVIGNEFVAMVPVEHGPVLLSAVASSASGPSASTTVPIVVGENAAAGEGLVASPVSGAAPLTVTFSVSGAPDDARIDFDVDGNGSVDFTAAPLEHHPFTFTSPGLYLASATITRASGQRTTVQTVVQVFDRAMLDGTLQAKWSAMKTALRTGDIPAALEFIVDRRRADYGQAFGILMPRLPMIDTIMTDITFVWMRNAAALYEMVRVDAGITRSFEIRFALGGDGVWRLESF